MTHKNTCRPEFDLVVRPIVELLLALDNDFCCILDFEAFSSYSTMTNCW